MVESWYIEVWAAHVAKRIHPARSGFRCRCGACRHQILIAAQRSGLDLAVLVRALEPERFRSKRGRVVKRDGAGSWTAAGARVRPRKTLVKTALKDQWVTSQHCCGDPLCRG